MLRYEKLTAGVEEENMGPLEATIRNLSKQIAAKVVEKVGGAPRSPHGTVSSSQVLLA